jgi:hypothetical protein
MNTRVVPRRARGRGIWLLVALLLASCATGPHLRLAGEPGRRSVSTTQEGVQLTLVPDAWTGYPASLSQRYLPVQARIGNGRQDEILVRFDDFLATDQAGNQYRAVPPSEVAQALFGALPAAPVQSWALAEAPLYASAWPWGPYRGYWYPPFYGPGYPWMDPWWDYPYTRPRTTPYDILSFGLREGRVLPGASVEGFLYLQALRPDARLLTLLWTPILPAGQPVTTFRAEFQVVR